MFPAFDVSAEHGESVRNGRFLTGYSDLLSNFHNVLLNTVMTGGPGLMFRPHGYREDEGSGSDVQFSPLTISCRIHRQIPTRGCMESSKQAYIDWSMHIQPFLPSQCKGTWTIPMSITE